MTTSRAKPSKRAERYGAGEIGYDADRDLWYGRVEFGRKPDGSRDRRRVTARDKDEMLEAFADLLDRKRRGERMPAARWTVRTWSEHYLEHELAPEKSRVQYGDALRNWIIPRIGSVPLAKLQPEHVDELKAALKRRGLSAGSIAKARTVLSSVVTAAVERKIVRENVVRLSRPPKTSKRVSDALTVGQTETVLEYVASPVTFLEQYAELEPAPDADRSPDRLEALAVLALMLGMRQAELLDLRWEAVDVKGRTLRVVDAKTAAGVRWIPLPDRVVDALKVHRKRQTAERLEAEAWIDAGLVFATTIGTRIDRRNCLRWWHGVTETAGVGRRRFHATRHTAATVMLNAGVPLEIVSAILGHSGLAITADLYAKSSAERLRGGADAIDRVYGAGS